MNSHSPRELVSRQWDAVHTDCVLCECCIQNDWASRSASSRQCTCPSYSSRAGFFFWQSITSPRSVSQPPLQPRFGSLQLLAFPKAKTAFASEEICECDGHRVHKFSQWRLTADWLGPRESDCSQMHSKVSSDWLLSSITTTQPVLEILKMAGYFPDRPRIQTHAHIQNEKEWETFLLNTYSLQSLHAHVAQWRYKCPAN